MFFHISSHFLIQNIGKKLGSKIQDRNLHAFVLQIFCCFQPYKSSSDNNGLLHLVFFHIRTNSRCIIRGTHFKYTLLCHTWNEQFCRRCSYSQNQLVISTDFFFSCKQILYCHLLFIRVQRYSLFSGSYLHSRQLCIFFRSVYNQCLTIFNQTAYIIRKPTPSVRNVSFSGDYCDFRTSVFSFQFGCCLGSCSNASYN